MSNRFVGLGGGGGGGGLGVVQQPLWWSITLPSLLPAVGKIAIIFFLFNECWTARTLSVAKLWASLQKQLETADGSRSYKTEQKKANIISLTRWRRTLQV